MSFAKPKVPLGIGDMMMRSPDPPLLFPADEIPAAQANNCGDSVSACGGCGAMETIVNDGRHQCAYCRADRNGRIGAASNTLADDAFSNYNTYLGLSAVMPEYMVRVWGLNEEEKL